MNEYSQQVLSAVDTEEFDDDAAGVRVTDSPCPNCNEADYVYGGLEGTTVMCFNCETVYDYITREVDAKWTARLRDRMPKGK